MAAKRVPLGPARAASVALARAEQPRVAREVHELTIWRVRSKRKWAFRWSNTETARSASNVYGAGCGTGTPRKDCFNGDYSPRRHPRRAPWGFSHPGPAAESTPRQAWWCRTPPRMERSSLSRRSALLLCAVLAAPSCGGSSEGDSDGPGGSSGSTASGSGGAAGSGATSGTGGRAEGGGGGMSAEGGGGGTTVTGGSGGAAGASGGSAGAAGWTAVGCVLADEQICQVGEDRVNCSSAARAYEAGCTTCQTGQAYCMIGPLPPGCQSAAGCCRTCCCPL